MLKKENEFEIWTKKQDVTEKIQLHAEEFANLYPEDANLLSMKKNMMLKNIDKIIKNLSLKDRIDPNVRQYESALLSYLHSFFCRNFNGRCYGDFNQKNAGAAFYTLRFCTNYKAHNLAVPFNYAIENRTLLSEYISKFASNTESKRQ